MALRQARERGEREEAYYKEKLETLRERTENYDVSAKKQQQIIATTKQEIKQKSEQLLKVKVGVYDVTSDLLSNDDIICCSSPLRRSRSSFCMSYMRSFLLKWGRMNVLSEILRFLMIWGQTEHLSYNPPFWPYILYCSAPAKDDEAVASGLGYVVHLLLLCSKYLEVKHH